MPGLIRRALSDNLALKLAALAITLVLFLVVRGGRDAVTTVHAKVVYVHPPDRVLVSETVPELRITVRGPQGRLGRLDERDLESVHVDLREARDGELRFSEDMMRLPPGLRVEAIHPSAIPLAFEPRLERELPVQAVLTGEPARGFHVVRVGCEPQRVVLSGPRSVVERALRAPTRPLRLAEARESVRGEVPLLAPPPHAEWRPDGPVSVIVEVRADSPASPPSASAAPSAPGPSGEPLPSTRRRD